MDFTQEQKEIFKKINALKKQKKAVILVHNYQRPEIYEVADYIGDSLGLCQNAAFTDAEIILFCGVHFMAETAAIMLPNKKVIVPFLDAGCAMADMIDDRDLIEFKKQHPKAAVVCYVNSTAAIKACSDVACTSSNAVEVVSKLEEEEIIFVPDKNLGAYVQSKLKDKKIISWNGFCPIHHSLTKSYIEEVRSAHPKAKIIAHPECRPEVLELADYVSSTSGMIDVARKDEANEFFVLTECGMSERLRKELPKKKFYGLCNMCFDMKKNTIESVLKALETESELVSVDETIACKARISIERMFTLTGK